MNQFNIRKLEPWDIDKVWPILRGTLSQMSLPGLEFKEENRRHLLNRLLTGAAQLWVIGPTELPKGVLLTTLEADTTYDFKYLHIMSFEAFETLDLAELQQLEHALIAYAHSKKCAAMIARIPDKKLQQFVMRRGAKPIPMYYMEV